DLNNQTTSYGYDLMNRLTQATYPDTGQMTKCYSDTPGAACYSANPQLSQTTTQKIASGINQVSVSLLDGVGNVVQTQLTSDPEGTDFVDTTYDGAGRKK